MKKIFIFLSLILMFLFNTNNPTSHINANQTNCEVSITPIDQYKDKNWSLPDDNNLIWFNINLIGTQSDTVVVHYRTYDISAVASAGDYEYIDREVIFSNESNTSKLFAIEVGSVTFGILDSTGEVRTRSFGIEIYKVEGEAKISDQNEIICMLGYSSNRTISSKLEHLDSSHYTDYEKIHKSRTIDSPEYDNLATWSTQIDLSNDPLFTYWKQNYIQTKEAELFANFDGLIDDWGFNVYDSEVSLYDTNGNIIAGIRSHGWYDNHRMNPNLQHHEDYHSWYEKIYFNFRTIRYYEPLACNCGSCNEEYYNSWFYRVNTDPIYKVYFWTEGGFDRCIKNFSIYSTIIDRFAPTVNDVYYDANYFNNKDKVKINVRFSEKIHLADDKNNLPYLNVKINNDKVVQVPLSNYDLCKGTDTLSFELDVLDFDYNGNITSLTVESIGNANNISDYGGIYYHKKTNSNYNKKGELIFNNNTVEESNVNKTFEVNIQSYYPNIIMTPNTEGSLRQHSVTLELELDINNVDIYYTWSTSKETPTEYEYSSTITNGMKIITESGLDGIYYLHVKAESNMGKVTYTCLEEPLYFDNSPPITTTEVSGDYKQKTFEITVKDLNEESSKGINYIYMVYRMEGELEYKTKLITELEANIYEHKMSYIVNAADVGVGVDEFKDVEIGFYATDYSGNYNEDFESICETIVFDTRNIFFAEVKGVSSGSDAKILIEENNTLVVQKNTTDIVLDFINTDTNTYEGFTPLLNKLISVKTGEEFNTVTAEQKNGYTSFKFDVPVGYYKFTMEIQSSIETILSQEYHIYITNGNEDTANYINTQSQYVLNNYVYQLSVDNPYFYYLDTAGSVVVEPYATKLNPASFSSKEIAYNYVYFKELSDLYAIRLTSDLATYLNSSVTSYVKAQGEDTIAKEGQIWIRYKAQNWNYQGLNNTWVYYCYNSSTTNSNNFTIDVLDSNLPVLLHTALESVSNYICSLGEYKYLVDSENINKYGAPTLLKEQIFPEELNITGSNCGTKFKSQATYLGDKNIKKSTVKVNNETYLLATNYIVYYDTYTAIYYKRANTEDVYSKAKLKEGLTYGSMINANGIYEIIEATSEGCKQYYVYIDKEAPLIELKWYDSLDQANTLTLSEEHAGMYINATKASIHQMVREADDLAYVLLYKTSSKKLLHIITKEMLKKEIQLEDEHYTMHVYDRSGNNYVIYFRIDSSELECEVIEAANEYIKINTNRDESQIKTFEVYCNNQLITNTYSSSLKLNKSGTYVIKVVDWYGNEKIIDYSFSFDIPSVTWRYEIDGQTYVYTGDNDEMKITSLGKNSYFIVSQALLQFSIDGPYSFEFVGDVPEYTYTVINKRVKLKDVVPFSVKIYYTSQPNIFVIYNVSYDDIPPVIEASYIDNEYNTLEVEELYNEASNSEVGYLLVPQRLDYEISSIRYNAIYNGDAFYSNLIAVDLYDSVGVRDVYVYLDGQLLLHKDSNELSTIILSRTGNYKIVAYDVLDNEAIMQFVNVEKESYNFTVDGCEDNVYGSSDSVLSVYEDAQIHYLVNDGNTKYYLGLSITDKVVYQTYYYVGLDSLGNKTLFIDSSNILFEINDTTSMNTYYDIYSDCCYYSIKYDENNHFAIKLNVYDDKQYYIQTRIEFNNNQIQLLEYYLSKLESTIDIIDKDNNVVEDDEYIYLSKSFTIDVNSIGLEVVEIKMYYSQVNVFDSYEYVYTTNNFEDLIYDEDGFYKFEVINIYNNVTTYNIIVSHSFNVTSEAVYKDGQSIVYSNDYNDVIKSNNKINLYAYSQYVTVEVLKDGKNYKVKVNSEDNYYSISLNEVGEYQIKIIDQYGNEKNLSAVIKFNNISFVEELIYGYNEEALLKDKGYTNQKLSINSDLFDDLDIAKVSVYFENEEYIIYDTIGENNISNELNQCIGFDNKPGVYQVYFRDSYGNVVSKEIKYSDVPTLKLSRTTRNANTDICDIEDVLVNGFWSNMLLNFDSTSIKYEFEINGIQYQFPKTLAFDVDLVEGDKVYTVRYLDEYGFKYEFNAYLSRKEINLEIENSNYKLINNIKTVKDEIKLIYDDSLTILYTIDSLNKKVYEGEKLIVDGVYRFEAVDLAGNMSSLTVAKDTYVYYDFYQSAVGKTVVNGGIANTDRVVFRVLNDDTSYIEKVYRNGEEVKDFDGIFNEHGYWEVIISDEMDNKEIFSFSIITNKLSKFEYKTPEQYKIVEVLFDSGDGVKNSYLEYVDQYDFSSHIIVEEDGMYQVKMTSLLTGENIVFNFTIDKSVPVIVLDGVETEGHTINDVYIKGYNVGDTVYIYRDGKLVEKIKITSIATEVPVIDEGGSYEIIVESEASIQTIVTFTRAHMPNTASSILIIITIMGLVVALFGGLVFRNRLKVDE